MIDTKSPMQELNTKQYYETVDVATGELPEKNHVVYCVKLKNGLFADRTGLQLNEWSRDNIVSWLRPVSLSELIRDKLTGFLESEIKADRCDLYETPEIFSQQFINSLK